MFYVTGFKPFNGRAKNGSETLVNALSACPELAHVTFKVLDVSWGGFDSFYTELAGSDVTGIIGMGEGGGESIVIERVGHNIASGMDEHGVEKKGAVICPDHGPTNTSRISIPVGVRAQIKDSRDAGRFLCNYELFHINTLPVDTSAFIHLPPQGDVADDVYIESVYPTVVEIVQHNFVSQKP